MRFICIYFHGFWGFGEVAADRLLETLRWSNGYFRVTCHLSPCSMHANLRRSVMCLFAQWSWSKFIWVRSTRAVAKDSNCIPCQKTAGASGPWNRETVEASVLLEVKYIGVDIVSHVIEESRSDFEAINGGGAWIELTRFNLPCEDFLAGYYERRISSGFHRWGRPWWYDA